MSAQSRYMLLFSLGPVQPFIAQARKTRDLWVGSLLIANLMQAAMKDVPKEAFIFPAEQKVKDIPDIPNKYVALFADLDAAQQAAKQSRENVKEHWAKIGQAVWRKVIADYADEQTESIWKRQINFETLFEVYWAITEEGEKKYKDWLEETEQLLAARKRLRDFVSQNEFGEKSATSGDREVSIETVQIQRVLTLFGKRLRVSHLKI